MDYVNRWSQASLQSKGMEGNLSGRQNGMTNQDGNYVKGGNIFQSFQHCTPLQLSDPSYHRL
jgi:hypothetical protein